MNPPRQASTWQPTPRSAASAAISGIGSITPCGKPGADPTTTAVRSVTAAASASVSARNPPSTGTRTSGMSKNRAALSNAAWAVTGATISGAAMPRRSRAWSR